ncbi:MAG: hypothetical protein KGH61_03970 [Candidatus Micrarchaeota archaeon]|nr:hypothetical protein [Candidatus Micrarchaeota archaeon]MDE1848077.1 hypothetical protein [Candidatus Micrarchaeota archaeon]MDE1864868.1 hypothetical protein [Candidatus Micrarchaeota archaeon]
MRGPSTGVLLAALLAVIVVSSAYNAEYWYQFGARAGTIAAGNNGAGVSIETITPQYSQSGSLGYWVGETLSNGAFVQAGYVIENQSGEYPSKCDLSGCYSYEAIDAGTAQWFYEYFPSGYSGGFLGQIGSQGSAGPNGSFHRYSFYSQGDNWYFTVDGNIVGNVTLGTSTSGPYVPVAFGEVANTTGIASQLQQVVFQNLSFYKNGQSTPVQMALSYIGYGVGSRTNLRNPYGVEELSNKVNYFVVGSGVSQTPNNTVLWNLGYTLSTSSQYAGINGTQRYIAYSNVQISAPHIVQLNSTAREVFAGWKGTGIGAYTGTDNSSMIAMNANITETAVWHRQYYFNVSSQFGETYGSGWYTNGTIVDYGASHNISQTSATSREAFSGWSNGNEQRSGYLTLNGSSSIRASWKQQFMVDVQSQYGNVSGAGWYDNGSVAEIGIGFSPINLGEDKRLGFYGWSNGNSSSQFSVLVDRAVLVSAQFRDMYRIDLEPQNAYGTGLGDVTLYVNNRSVDGNDYFFQGASYQIDYAYYKGVRMRVGYNFSVSGAQRVNITLPVYNIAVGTRDIFGMPLNSSVALTFSNGTTENGYTGSGGILSVSNAPYGYATGNAMYLGIKQPVNVSQGDGSNLLFLSILDMGIILLVMAAIGASYFVSKRHFGGKTMKGLLDAPN